LVYGLEWLRMSFIGLLRIIPGGVGGSGRVRG